MINNGSTQERRSFLTLPFKHPLSQTNFHVSIPPSPQLPPTDPSSSTPPLLQKHFSKKLTLSLELLRGIAQRTGKSEHQILALVCQIQVRERETGRGRKGKERKGKERKGKERKGKERKGKERKEDRKKKKKKINLCIPLPSTFALFSLSFPLAEICSKAPSFTEN